ncbi:MAG: MFS transporter [Pseudomonadales bacterium]|nr:MFS transporter [Pseudomonadales bacterium]
MKYEIIDRKKLERNIPVLSVFSFFWLSMVILPVIVPFFASKGLSLTQVYYLQAIFAAVVVVSEIPSGYIADVLGRKNALVAGSLFHGVGFTLLYFADDFVGLVFFEVCLGIGLSLLSGADLSLLYDSQTALEHSPAEKTRGIANMRFAKSIGEGSAALLGGFLIAFSFDVTVIVNGILGWIPLVLSLFLVEPPFQKMKSNQHLENMKEIMNHLYFRDALLRQICLNITFFGLATFYVVWMLQPYWQDQNIPLTAFGMLWAAFSFLVGVSSKFSMQAEKKFGTKNILIVMGVLPIVGYFGMSVTTGVLGVVLCAGFFISRGINQVILTDALNSRVPSSFRATANSITSFMFRGIYIVTGPLVGWLIEKQGMQTTLGLLGLSVIALLFLSLLPLLRAIDRVKVQEVKCFAE